MASSDAIVTELLMEAGLNANSPVRRQFETAVGDITVDLLSQNQGKFYALKKTHEFTLTASDKKTKLPTDFNSAANLYEVDDTGGFVAWGFILERAAVFENMIDDAYVGHRQGWIEELSGDDAPSGRGLYLVLGDEPDDTVYMVLDYYRKATPADTDLIHNPSIVKDGVRSRFPDHWPDFQVYLVKYDRARSGFRETRERRRTAAILRPSRRVAEHNKRMHRIGKRNR